MTWRGLVLAAVFAAGDGAVASGATAAALWGFDRVGRPERIEVTVARSALPVPAGVAVHRTRALPACDRAMVHGIPVTTPARTIVDLAASLDRWTLTGLVDDAIGAKAVTRRHLYTRASALRRGRKGVPTIVQLCAPGAPGTFRSWLEREASQNLGRHGVPQPEWNVPVYDDDGLIGVVDGLHRAEKVISEYEGPRFHATPRQRREDAARFNRFQVCGHVVLRFTWADVVERPTWVAEQTLAMLTARRRVDFVPASGTGSTHRA